MSDFLNLPGNEQSNLPINLHQDTFEWAMQKTYEFARLMSCYFWMKATTRKRSLCLSFSEYP